MVPSSTREGSEAFLRHLRSNREWFEYEIDDKANLEDLFKEVRVGRLTIAEARKQLANTGRSFVEVSRAGTAPLSSVVRELGNEVTEEATPNPFGAIPGIDRREEETEALILTSDTPVNGYNCFLSISDRVQRERGDFFLQPHSTEVVWGGRKVLFIFQHHAKQFWSVLRYPLSRTCWFRIWRRSKDHGYDSYEESDFYSCSKRDFRRVSSEGRGAQAVRGTVRCALPCGNMIVDEGTSMNEMPETVVCWGRRESYLSVIWIA